MSCRCSPTPTRTDQRHQTLEAVLAWSFDLLTENLHHVLERISIFAGVRSGLAAAEQVAPRQRPGWGRPSTMRIASLVDKSLVVRHPGRFRLLDTTRGFYLAARRADAVGRRGGGSSTRGHTRFVIDRASVIRAGLHGRRRGNMGRRARRRVARCACRCSRALDNDDADTVITLVTLYALREFLAPTRSLRLDRRGRPPLWRSARSTTATNCSPRAPS